MPALPKLRKAPWFAGAVLLLLAAGIVLPLGYALGVRSWPFFVGLAAAGLLLVGWGERIWKRRPVSLPPRSRSKFRLLAGGRKPDLRQDDSNDNPRWLV